MTARRAHRFPLFCRVRVRAVPERGRPIIETRRMQVGDVGVVVMLLEAEGMPLAYSVECNSSNGEPRWLADIPEDCLEAVEE